MALSNDAICQLFVSDEPGYAINNSGSMRIIGYRRGINNPGLTNNLWELTTYGVTLAIRDHTIDEVPRIYINPAQYSITSSKQRGVLYAALSWRGPRVWEMSGQNRTMYCDRWDHKGGYDGEWQEYLPTNVRRIGYQEARDRGLDWEHSMDEELQPLRVKEGVALGYAPGMVQELTPRREVTA